jgi:hypothetical protein
MKCKAALHYKSSMSKLTETVDFVREMEISRAMARCPLQDPLRFRARFLGLEIGYALVDDLGQLDLALLKNLIDELESGKFLIGPGLENDLFLFEHILSSMRFLYANASAQKLLHKFSPLVCHKGAERLVRDTLWPHAPNKLEEADVKRAVLAAWFTWLRQTTGSCFATAPAILVQQRQPLRFLQDIYDILTFGAMKRIVAGQEYSVPLCPSLELADLLRPLAPYSTQDLAQAPGIQVALASAGLKGFVLEEEMTTPKELIEGAIRTSLGLSVDDIREEEGLQRIEMSPLLAKQSGVYYQRPSERAKKVADWKNKTAVALASYQSLGDCALLRAWEATMASFSDVKVDIGRWNLYVSLGINPDQPGGIGEFLYQRLNVRLQNINRQLQGYQAEYEAMLRAAKNAQRAGREAEYTSAAYAAGSLGEQIRELSRMAEEISTLLRDVIQTYDRLIPESFQEIFDPSLAENLSEIIDDSPAGFRLAYKHGRATSSQWTYIRSSDQFIHSLREFFVSAEREVGRDPVMVEELTTELIQFVQTDEFLAGALARARANPAMQGAIAKPWEYISGGTMPSLVMTYFNRSEPLTVMEKNVATEADILAMLIPGKEPLLMHSPTHAFVYHPEWLPPDLKHALSEMQHFWGTVPIQDVDFLAEKLATWLPSAERALFLHLFRQQSVREGLPAVRMAFIQALPRHRDPETLVDSFLYESLPLIDAKVVGLPGGAYYTPMEAKEQLKMVRSGFSSEDLDLKFAEQLRRQSMAAPAPILFADTNWSSGFFGLAISPNHELNLWRFQRTGMAGYVMRNWFQRQQKGLWTLFTQPQEYTYE